METEAGPHRSGDSSPRVKQKPPISKKPILPPSTRQQKGIIKTRQEPIDSPITKPPVPPPKPKASPQSTRRPQTLPNGKSFDSSQPIQEEDNPPAKPPRSVSLDNDTKEDLRGRHCSQRIHKEFPQKVPSKLLQSISFDNDATTNRYPSQPIQEEEVTPAKPPRTVSLDNEDLKGRQPSQPIREKESPQKVPVKSVSFDNDATTNIKGKHPSQPIQEEEFPPKVAAKPPRSVTFANDVTTNLSPLFPREATVKVPHSEAIPLTELFTEQYSNRLPLRIIILQGYRGTIPELCISTSDVYNIHFMKHRSVVCIKDSMGQIYSVPINSSVQFGLVYNPDGRSTAYSTFLNVADILAQKTLPKIVCVTQTFDGASDKSIVQKNELLVILKAHRSKMRRKGLEVHSLLTKSNKFLTGDCKGHFTTDPAKTRLHLPTIVDHIRDPFPNMVVLFPSKAFASSAQEVSSSLFSGPVTMLYAKKETSLVATAVIDELESEARPLLDFPHDDCLSEVQVAILDDCESLYENTQSLYQNFDLSKLKSCKDTGSRDTYDTQEFFYTACQEGFEKYGVELLVSLDQYAEVRNHHGVDTVATSESGDSDNYEEVDNSDNSDYEVIKDPAAKSSDHSVVPPPLPKLKPPIRSTLSPPAPLSRAPVAIPSDADDCEYDIPDVTRRHVDMPPIGPKQAASLPNPTNAPHYALVRTQSASAKYYDYTRSVRRSSSKDEVERNAILAELKELRSDITQLSSRVERLEKYIGLSQLDITQLSSQFEQLEKYIGSSQLDTTHLSSRVEQLEKYSGSSKSTVVPQDNAHSNEEKNGNHLRALTHEQVQEMLDKMGLAQYKDIFARERITGDVLSELSEEDLQHELGITSRIHRIRLMKVITG